jgi:AcrR family transcriptional regulator
MAKPTARPLRRDAAENREKLIDAATRVFAEHGRDATVEEVAREAGVGMGTLYRRFPHKQALIDELVGGVRRELLVLAQTAAQRADGFGLEELLFHAGQLQADQPGCLQRLWSHSDAELDRLQEFRRVLVTLLDCAQQHGRIRLDVTSTDVTMLLWSLRGVIETTRDVAPTAWRRHLELLIAGFRPPGSRPGGNALVERPLSEKHARQISATQFSPNSPR